MLKLIVLLFIPFYASVKNAVTTFQKCNQRFLFSVHQLFSQLPSSFFLYPFRLPLKPGSFILSLLFFPIILLIIFSPLAYFLPHVPACLTFYLHFLSRIPLSPSIFYSTVEPATSLLPLLLILFLSFSPLDLFLYFIYR